MQWIYVLARIQMQVLVECVHDGGTGCNLIGYLAQSFGAGGNILCKKTIPDTIRLKKQKNKNELATMLLMVPKPRETPATEHKLRFWTLRVV